MNAGPDIRTLADIPRVHGRARPAKAALFFEDRETTYRDLDAQSDRVARSLKASGLRRGDRIIFLGKNADTFFELLFGAAKSGVVLTPINWRLAPREIKMVVDDCEAKLLFLDSQLSTVADALSLASESLTIIGLDAPIDGREYSTWRDDASRGELPGEPAPEEAALMFYTSGTTGKPKGVVLTHRALIGMQRNYIADGAAWASWTDEDVSLVVTPCFHIAAVAWALTSLYNGASIAIARDFDPGQILTLLEVRRISKLLLVPAAMQLLARHPDARETDFSRLKYMVYGAAPIPLEALRECIVRFKCRFVQVYGMTETSGGIVALGPDDHDPAGVPRMRSAGKAIAGVEVAILDADGRRLPPFAVGEITTRSVGLMKEYWRSPEATAAAIDSEGWLRTGDAGYLDEGRYLFISDRVKDMIISGGENIYPAEVEAAICDHPAVAEVAVIGTPSERWGEEVKAIVVARLGTAKDSAAIIAWARERVAAYKAPKSIDFVEVLPRNGAGKILRRELRAPYWGATNGK